MNTLDRCESMWSVRVVRKDDAQGRNDLLQIVKPRLEQYLANNPGARSFDLPTPIGSIALRLEHGSYKPGGNLRIVFPPEQTIKATPEGSAVNLATIRLPDQSTKELGERLVGLDEISQALRQHFGCAWDCEAQRWSTMHKMTLSPGLESYLSKMSSFMVFTGVPGTGKSALATTEADRYCREREIAGTIVYLSTEVRGSGLVNDGCNKMRLAFRELAAMPDSELKVLVIEEADSIAMRRNDAQAHHHEDRSLTDSLLQCLDDVAGRFRLAVILTTNSTNMIDPAVQRRSVVYEFQRPNRVARLTMLRRWLNHLSERELARLSEDADGMTPADIDTALGQLWLGALRTNAPIAFKSARMCLKAARRTQEV